MPTRPRIAYLFSRYPVVSQTFCDTEILALERHGLDIEINSIHPPHTSFRHGHASRISAPIYYAPPQTVLKLGEKVAKTEGRWPTELVERHEKEFGKEFKPAIRARNALYFARSMTRRGVSHIHVHFANRAAYTARFIKELAGIPYSFTAHAQDFMVDLAQEGALRELCAEAAFVITVSDYTRDLLARTCPDSAERIHRVYNGINLEQFPLRPAPQAPVASILAVGRLVEFKGFHHLIRACGDLRRRGLTYKCEIVGEGPERQRLLDLIAEEKLEDCVTLTGVLTQEEIATRLSACQVFALASDIDSNGASDVLPTVILEAMAAGRPVVSTRVAGIPELVANEETGILVDRGDVQGFSRALFRLLADHELRMRFGMAGRKRLEACFKVERTSGELKQHFENLPMRPDSLVEAKPPQPAALFAYLMDTWPTASPAIATSELDSLAATEPAPRLFVLRPGESLDLQTAALTDQLEFLPDAMVLEADWRHNPSVALRAETLRDELGDKISTEEFLRQGRVAAHLLPRLRRLKVAHLHAAGLGTAICAWILHRLDGISYSLTLPTADADLIGAASPIVREAEGGRTGNTELVAADPRFEAYAEPGQPKPGWVGSILRGRKQEPTPTPSDWFERLARWTSPA